MARTLGGAKGGEPGAVMARIGVWIAARREHLGWSQSELARRSEVDRVFLNDIESGKRNATIETLARLAKALNIRVHRLVSLAERGFSTPAEKEAERKRVEDLKEKVRLERAAKRRPRKTKPPTPARQSTFDF